MGSRHLPARCTPAVNQCLAGAASTTTPREMRAAKGHLQFPQPLTVAARTEPGACQPLTALSHFQMGKRGSERGGDLVGGRTSVAGGAGLPAQPLWAGGGLSPPHCSPRGLPRTLACSVLPVWKEDDPGGLGRCPQALKGHREAQGTQPWRRKDIHQSELSHKGEAATH